MHLFAKQKEHIDPNVCKNYISSAKHCKYNLTTNKNNFHEKIFKLFFYKISINDNIKFEEMNGIFNTFKRLHHNMINAQTFKKTFTKYENTFNKIDM